MSRNLSQIIYIATMMLAVFSAGVGSIMVVSGEGSAQVTPPPTPAPFCAYTYNIKDFGAVGLGSAWGSADVTGFDNAVLAALATPPPSMGVNKGQSCVYIPAGNYSFSVSGSVASLGSYGLMIEGEGADTIIDFPENADGIAFGSATAPITGSGAALSIHDLQFTCSSCTHPLTDTTGAAIHIFGKNFGNFRVWNIDDSGPMPYCFEDNDGAGGRPSPGNGVKSALA